MLFATKLMTTNINRFLQGEVALEGLWTSDLHDAWPAFNQALPGLTFSALDDQPVKRVGWVFMVMRRDLQANTLFPD